MVKKILKGFISILFMFSILSSIDSNEVYADCGIGIEGDNIFWVEQGIEYSEFGAVGKVLDVKFVPFNLKTWQTENPYILFEVEKSWKKETPSQLFIEVNMYNGMKFEKGKQYMIYFEEDKERFYVGMCYLVVENPTKEEIRTIDERFESFIPTEKLDIKKEKMFVIEHPWVYKDSIIKIIVFTFVIIILLVTIRKIMKKIQSKKEEKGEDKNEEN